MKRMNISLNSESLSQNRRPAWLSLVYHGRNCPSPLQYCHWGAGVDKEWGTWVPRTHLWQPYFLWRPPWTFRRVISKSWHRGVPVRFTASPRAESMKMPLCGLSLSPVLCILSPGAPIPGTVLFAYQAFRTFWVNAEHATLLTRILLYQFLSKKVECLGRLLLFFLKTFWCPSPLNPFCVAIYLWDVRDGKRRKRGEEEALNQCAL